MKFKKVSANKASSGRRRLIFGVGINDADYQVRPKPSNGKKQVSCPFYRRWAVIVKRCYSSDYQSKNTFYTGWTMCDEWLLFSTFKTWMEAQPWKGGDMNSTIIDPKNKIYSPRFCRFVPRQVQQMLKTKYKSGSKMPTCVTRSGKRFSSRLNIDGQVRLLGTFRTIELASNAYKEEKAKVILEAASKQSDPSVASGLRAISKLLTHAN